jgi:hypothetical protein
MKKFNTFDYILVRDSAYDDWTADFYDRPCNSSEEHRTTSGRFVKDFNILPYNEETKHLHGTVGEFIEWKPRKGEPILVRDIDDDLWTLRIFLEMQNERFLCTAEPEALYHALSWKQAKPYINPFKE